ncbi:hypothetical protein [Bacillus cereus]|uniref:hypothetical protein n=1 Tax=Bacillus cereus TaxID=1396 RepID=UPI001145EA73|nr:hypothetical protein [Bacillus cereus]
MKLRFPEDEYDINTELKDLGGNVHLRPIDYNGNIKTKQLKIDIDSIDKALNDTKAELPHNLYVYKSINSTDSVGIGISDYIDPSNINKIKLEKIKELKTVLTHSKVSEYMLVEIAQNADSQRVKRVYYYQKVI